MGRRRRTRAERIADAERLAIAVNAKVNAAIEDVERYEVPNEVHRTERITVDTMRSLVWIAKNRPPVTDFERGLINDRIVAFLQWGSSTRVTDKQARIIAAVHAKAELAELQAL